MSDREELQGVGRTLLLLADGLVRDGFLDPEENPTPYVLMKELREDTDAADGVKGIDVSRLPLLVLQVARIAQLLGVRPTEASGDSETKVGIEIADVAGGLELLTQLPQEASLELRGIATAISVLFDYAYVVVEPLLRESEVKLDVVSLSKGALAVAEISVRRALDGRQRGEIAVALLRRCADSIEAEGAAARAEAASPVEDGEDGSDGG